VTAAKLPWMSIRDVRKLTNNFIIINQGQVIEVATDDLSKPFVVLDLSYKHAYVAKFKAPYTYSSLMVERSD